MANLAYKRVTTYVNSHSTTVDAETLYYYGYDQVGNVVFVSEDTDMSTSKEFVFHQDAFGNELNTGVFASSSWTTADARTTRITEHQTGKDFDEFTGLYYFSARWYDPMVGRFVGREPLLEDVEFVHSGLRNTPRYHAYTTCFNNPIQYVDPNGRFVIGIVALPILIWGERIASAFAGCVVGAVLGFNVGLAASLLCDTASCQASTIAGGAAGGCLSGGLVGAGGGILGLLAGLPIIADTILDACINDLTEEIDGPAIKPLGIR